MARYLLAGGCLAMSVGAASLLPAWTQWLVTGTPSPRGIAVGAVACILALVGAAALVAGIWQRRERSMPGVVVAVLALNTLFLALFSLEISDGMVYRDGAMPLLSSIFFLPAFALWFGLLSGRQWAWFMARIFACLFVLWFLGGSAIIPFAELHSDQGPVPVWGRVYMVMVSLVLASVLAGGFLALGRPASRRYFGFEEPGASA